MRHPRVIIAGLGLALPIAASPPAPPRPLQPAAVRGADTASTPAAMLTTTGHKRAT
jgi:hypothetical protein